MTDGPDDTAGMAKRLRFLEEAFRFMTLVLQQSPFLQPQFIPLLKSLEDAQSFEQFSQSKYDSFSQLFEKCVNEIKSLSAEQKYELKRGIEESNEEKQQQIMASMAWAEKELEQLTEDKKGELMTTASLEIDKIVNCGTEYLNMMKTDFITFKKALDDETKKHLKQLNDRNDQLDREQEERNCESAKKLEAVLERSLIIQAADGSRIVKRIEKAGSSALDGMTKALDRNIAIAEIVQQAEQTISSQTDQSERNAAKSEHHAARSQLVESQVRQLAAEISITMDQRLRNAATTTAEGK